MDIIVNRNPHRKIERIGATITFRDDITVTVVNINKSQVKLGINAPKDINIKRPEGEKS